MVNVKFPFYEFSKKELREFKLDPFMPGWQDNTDYLDNDELIEVTDQQGKKWNLDKSLEIISGQLEFGNQEQIGAIKALDFLNYLLQARKIQYNQRRVKADFGDEL